MSIVKIEICSCLGFAEVNNLTFVTESVCSVSSALWTHCVMQLVKEKSKSERDDVCLTIPVIHSSCKVLVV